MQVNIWQILFFFFFVFDIHSWNSQVVFNFLQNLNLSIRVVVETSCFSIFNRVAKHDNTLYFFLLKHLFKILLGWLQGSLSNDDSLGRIEGDPVCIDVGWIFAFGLGQYDPTMLIYMIK